MQTKITGLTTTALIRTFLRTTSEGFWLTDNVGRILEVNQAYETMSGYVSGELVGMLAADLDVDDGLKEMAERVARIHRNGSEIFETRHRRKDGSIFAVEMSVTLLPRSGGQLVCLCRDITFRKQAEAALKRNVKIQVVVHKIAQAAQEAASLPELYATVQQLVDGILPAKNFHINLLDEPNRQILLRYSQGSPPGLLLQRPVGKGLTEYTVRLGQAVHLTQQDLQQLRDSGEAAAVYAEVQEWMGAPLRDTAGKVFGVVSLYLTDTDQHFQASDIHVLAIVAVQIAQAIEKTRVAETLRANEAEFRKLIRALPLPLAIINRAGEHTYINERFTQLFGYSYADIPTRDHWRKAAFPDENYRNLAVQAWKEAVDRVVNTQTDSEQVECDITCKNGSRCSVIVSCSLLGEDVIATFTDISERQRREQLLKATYERRRKSDLMNELIQTEMPDKRAVHESARLFGAKMMQPFSCFLVLIDTYQEQAREDWQKHPLEYQLLLDALLDALEASSRIVWDSPDGIGILWFDSTEGVINIDQQKTIAMTLCDILADKIPAVKVSIGIAEAATELSLLSSRYHQACRAVKTGRTVWPTQNCYHYLELGVFQLLSDVANETRSDEYIDRMLGKLLRYDKQKRDAYLTTLENILMSDNLKASAEKLAIHYHTLMFRKQRLEQILEVSFDDFAARLSILNALHLLKLRKK